MKKQINEIKRMQQLAGIIKESQLDEAKPVSKEDKIAVIKEWIWYTCDEGQAKEDINRYNKMVDTYFADKNDVTEQDFEKIWAKVTEKWGVGDIGADWEAFSETWADVQTGTLIGTLNEGQIPSHIEEFLNDMINMSIPEDADEGENVNGVWEVEEYGNKEAYGESAYTFKEAYDYIKSKGGEIVVPGEPDVTYDALNDGSIGYSLTVSY